MASQFTDPELNAIGIPAAVIRAVELDPADRIAVSVLAYLGQKTFPSLASIANMMGCTPRAARRTLRSLETKGWLVIETRKTPSGRDRTHHYRLRPLKPQAQDMGRNVLLDPVCKNLAHEDIGRNVPDMGRNAPRPERPPNSTDLNLSDPKIEEGRKIQEAAQARPPATPVKGKAELTHVQQIALVILADWTRCNRTEPDRVMRNIIFGGVSTLCRRYHVPTEWPVEHMLLVWRLWMESQKRDEWKFRWFIEKEEFARWHHEAIKQEENNYKGGVI